MSRKGISGSLLKVESANGYYSLEYFLSVNDFVDFLKVGVAVSEANSNLGSASHLGEGQMVRDSHFVYDYSRRRVPIPVISYMAVADAAGQLPAGESPSKKALDILRDLLEPAVIAEEELNSEQMPRLIGDAFDKINAALLTQEGATGQTQVSLTMVIADERRAYIGHIGTTRVYLLHNERLYDLVPSLPVPEPEPVLPSGDEPTLFPVVGLPSDTDTTTAADPTQEPAPAEVTAPTVETAATPVRPARGMFLGQSPEAIFGYNEVDIQKGDTVILCTDGLWSTVSEAEIVENLLSAANLQRSTSQLARLAFSRNPSDNATMAAWHYGSGEQLPMTAAGAARAARAEHSRATRNRAGEYLLIALLMLVLVGIFTVGFAFGWRITDTFRKPQKESASRAHKAAVEAEAKKAAQQSQAQAKTQASQPAGQFPRTETITGQGVRMRASPDTNANLVGLLKDGEKVTVLGEVAGVDSLTWSHVKGVVTSSGASKEAEGYVRNDFLKK